MKPRFSIRPPVSATYSQKSPLLVRWGAFSYDSIPLILGITDDGTVCGLAFAKNSATRSVPAAWKKSWPRASFLHDPKAVAATAHAIKERKPVRVRMTGTEFQCAVWKNLLAIPEGETVTYAELARRSQRPKAVRAAGTACGANPIVILVPCHRVIASDGSLGGFGGGLPTKIKLLKTEGFQQFKKR